jgi:hypothetical protein
MVKQNIDNGQDIMDSRDVIEALEEMETERQDLLDQIEDAEEADDKIDAERALRDWDETTGPEFEALKAFCEEGEGATSDWIHGATLIRDDYFKEYAQQFAEDIGAINREASWPNSCIDWDEAADELQQDYSSIEFDGVTYWVR